MSRTVILVDDDRLQLMAAAKMLESQLYDVHTFEDASDAIAYFGHSSVDVIVTDENMPGMQGSELIAWVAKHHPQTKRIILAAHAKVSIMLEAINSGAVFRFLTKPCNSSDLGSAVRAALELHELETKHQKLLATTQQQLIDLEAKNRELENFGLAVAHDLSEPLRMITRFSQLVKERYGNLLGDEGNELLDFSINGALQMKEQIAGLLEYSQIEASSQAFQKVDLNKVVARAMKLLQLPIAEASAVIQVDDLPTVVGETTQLVQLFQNLISNAIKFQETTNVFRLFGRNANSIILH